MQEEDPDTTCSMGIDPGLRNMGVVVVENGSKQILFAENLSPYNRSGDARKVTGPRISLLAWQRIKENDRLASLWPRISHVAIENQCFKANKKLTLMCGFLMGCFHGEGKRVNVVSKRTYMPAACTGSHHTNKTTSVNLQREKLEDFYGGRIRSHKKLDDIADALALAEWQAGP